MPAPAGLRAAATDPWTIAVSWDSGRGGDRDFDLERSSDGAAA